MDPKNPIDFGLWETKVMIWGSIKKGSQKRNGKMQVDYHINSIFYNEGLKRVFILELQFNDRGGAERFK